MAAAGETWRKTREEVWPEMKEKKTEKRYVMVYPEHYGSQGMWWATASITPAEYDSFILAHPGAQHTRTETV